MESLEEYEAVVSTMKKYVEACSTGDVELCKEAFDDNAVMYGYLNGTLYNGSINNFYEALKQVGGDSGTKTRIDVLALVGTEAVVRVVMNDWHRAASRISTRFSRSTASGRSYRSAIISTDQRVGGASVDPHFS